VAAPNTESTLILSFLHKIEETEQFHWIYKFT
jgi:hypothetical protein